MRDPVGIDEGARLVAGGVGRPEGLMRLVCETDSFAIPRRILIIREEIFGPVLAIMLFDTEEEAIALANDTPYGLAAYIQTGDMDRPPVAAIARRHDTGKWCQPDFR